MLSKQGQKSTFDLDPLTSVNKGQDVSSQTYQGRPGQDYEECAQSGPSVRAAACLLYRYRPR